MDQQLLRRDVFINPGEQKFSPPDPIEYLCPNPNCLEITFDSAKIIPIWWNAGRSFMGKNKIKRPSLKKAFRRVDRMPKEMFGTVDVDLTTLPCLVKMPKEKITANFDADLLEHVREFAKKNDVSYTNVMNDILRRAFGL